jgi:hypothetical protein
MKPDPWPPGENDLASSLDLVDRRYSGPVCACSLSISPRRTHAAMPSKESSLISLFSGIISGPNGVHSLS